MAATDAATSHAEVPEDAQRIAQGALEAVLLALVDAAGGAIVIDAGAIAAAKRDGRKLGLTIGDDSIELALIRCDA